MANRITKKVLAHGTITDFRVFPKAKTCLRWTREMAKPILITLYYVFLLEREKEIVPLK